MKKKKISNPFNLALIQARAHMNLTPTKKGRIEKELRKNKCNKWKLEY